MGNGGPQMRKVKVLDTTLRDGEQSAGVNLNESEKKEIAKQLVRLGVDAIEAGFPIASPGDFQAVKKSQMRLKEQRLLVLQGRQRQILTLFMRQLNMQKMREFICLLPPRLSICNINCVNLLMRY